MITLYEKTGLLLSNQNQAIVAQDVHQYALALTDRSFDIEWEYAEVMYHFKKMQLWTHLGYASFEEYMTNANTLYSFKRTYGLIAVYRTFIFKWKLHDIPEMSALLFSIKNIDLLMIICTVCSKAKDLSQVKFWLEKALEIKDSDRLRYVVNLSKRSGKLPTPDQIVTPSKRIIKRWSPQFGLPTEDEMFGDIPPNAIVQIDVKIIGYKVEDENDG